MPTSRRLGVLVSSLGPGDPADSLLRAAYRRDDVDVVAFVLNHADAPRVAAPFAAMNVAEAHGFDGPAVATCVATAEALLRLPGPSRRLFYNWDVRWGGHDWRRYAAAYRDPRLPVVARCEDHRRVIERCWNARVCGVVGGFDLGGLIEILEREG